MKKKNLLAALGCSLVLGTTAMTGCVIGDELVPSEGDPEAGDPVLAEDPAPTVDYDTRFHRTDAPIEGSYIAIVSQIYLRESGQSAADVAEGLAADYGVDAPWAGENIACVMFNGTEEQALALSEDPRVDSVTEDSVIDASDVQANAIPGLDIIDGVRDDLFTFNATGAGVTVFVLDTGINPHAEFGDRLELGGNFVPDGRDASDCQGHGTHVASTSVGSRVGVAKDARVVSMRVLGCNGSGSTNGIIRAINATVAQAQEQNLRAVINMSLGGGASLALDQAVTRAMDAGVFVAVAAGNETQNACNVSPARSDAMTTCATTFSDRRAGFSNFGQCVDICAPGQGIAGASANNPNGFVNLSGTSMASPHVAGAAAQAMEAFPQASAREIKTLLINQAKTGIQDLRGSPDRLLFTGFIDSTPPDDGGNGGDPGNEEPPAEEEPPVGTPRTGSATSRIFRNQELRFRGLPVLPGSQARIQLSGNGDADLYVRFNAAPTVTRFDCRPFRVGSNEVCSGTVPAGANTMFIMVRGFNNVSDVRIDAEWVEP